MPQTQSKSSQTPNTWHYRLTTEEWLKASQELNKAELTILYYLRTLSPWADKHLNLKIIDIAAACQLAKGTVSKALHKLDEMGWIDLEMVTVRIKLNLQNSLAKFPTGNQVSQEKPEYPIENQIIPEVSSRKPARTTGNFSDSEPLQQENSSAPQTYLNSLNHSNYLNEREGEIFISKEFRSWLKRKMANLPQQPEFVEQWMQAQGKNEAVKSDFQKWQTRNAQASISPRESSENMKIEPVATNQPTELALASEPAQPPQGMVGFSEDSAANFRRMKELLRGGKPDRQGVAIDLQPQYDLVDGQLVTSYQISSPVEVMADVMSRCEQLGWSEADLIDHMQLQHGWPVSVTRLSLIPPDWLQQALAALDVVTSSQVIRDLSCRLQWLLDRLGWTLAEALDLCCDVAGWQPTDPVVRWTKSALSLDRLSLQKLQELVTVVERAQTQKKAAGG